MKKKQIIIRIMFVVAGTSLAIFGYKTAVIGVAEATSISIKQETQNLTKEVSEEVSKEISNEVSTHIEGLTNELNTKVETINEENQKLRTTIESQAKQIAKLSGALKELGINFQ